MNKILACMLLFATTPLMAAPPALPENFPVTLGVTEEYISFDEQMEYLRGRYAECFEAQRTMDGAISCLVSRQREEARVIAMMEVLAEARKRTLEAQVSAREDIKAVLEGIQESDDPIGELIFWLNVNRTSLLRYEAEEVVALMKDRKLLPD